MQNNNIIKLCSYCLKCLKSTSKNTAFNNVKNCKMLILDDKTNIFESDNKKIIELMTLKKLNKDTMNLYLGYNFFIKSIENNKIYSPLLYCDADLIRQDDKIILSYDLSELKPNINVISSILNSSDDEIIENIVSQILELENLDKIDFCAVLNGLMDLKNYNIFTQTALILAEIPENISGICKELKEIIKLTK